MDRLQQQWAWLRESRLRIAAVAVVAIAAISAGVAFGMIGTSGRETASGSSSSPLPSESASAEVSAAEGASPSQSPQPSETLQAGATSTPEFAPTPRPTPSPQSGVGGLPGTTFDITGVWRELAPMPGGDDFMTSDALNLPGHGIAVFRWDSGADDPADLEVVVYEPATNEWDVVTFAGERPFVGTDQPFVLAPDGKIYTYDTVIDPSADEWTAEPYDLIRETDVWAGTGLAVGIEDSRIYRRAGGTGSSRTELIAHTPGTDEFERTASTNGSFDILHWATVYQLVLFGFTDNGPAMITYDFDRDRWSGLVEGISDEINAWHAAPTGFGDYVYVPGLDPDVPQLWAMGIDDGSMRSVQVPAGVTDWAVELLWVGDDRLMAFGRESVWEFTLGR